MKDVDDDWVRQYACPRTDNQSASVIQIESGKLMQFALAMVCIAIAIGGVALGISMGARDTAQRAERESRMQRLETDELKAAVVRSGINIHLETDSP